jgi:hypothetical protein
MIGRKKSLSVTLEFPCLPLLYQIQLLLLDEIKAAEKLSELGKEPLLSETNTCFCRVARSYWLPCPHVIASYEFLGLIDEPD